MSFGFNFQNRPLTDGVLVPRCHGCGNVSEALSCEGHGGKGIMVVFDRPTALQWKERSWFADRSCTVFQALMSHGILLEDDIWVTGALRCRSNTPHPERYESCQFFLDRDITACNPKLIITVGSSATGAVLRRYHPAHFSKNITPDIYYGRRIPLNQMPGWNCWLAPVYSDDAISQYTNGEVKGVARYWVSQNVLSALGWCAERPPVYSVPKIELLTDRSAIIDAIRQAESSELTAFDYETNRLEPQYPDSQILTAGLSMGTGTELKRTVAFPFSGFGIREAWCRYLVSPVKKMGANIKYEHYWSSVFLKTPVANWKWDVGVGARVFECRPGMAGLKYVTFVTLGIIGYDDEVDIYMKSKEDGTNRLSEMNPVSLLTYNAYDAAYTYEVALRQSKLLGFPI